MRYSWRKEEYPERNFDDRVQLGFIAQEIEKILPEVVDTDTNGWKSVQYTQIVALLVEASKSLSKKYDAKTMELQQVSRKVNELEKTSIQLESKIKELELRLESLFENM